MLENGESIRARPHNAGGNRMRAMLREGGASCAKATRRACQDGARMLENGEAIGAPPHNAGGSEWARSAGYSERLLRRS